MGETVFQPKKKKKEPKAEVTRVMCVEQMHPGRGAFK